jgi:hypothetical protein
MSEMKDPTPLSIAQSQIVALQSRQYALEQKINDLITLLAYYCNEPADTALRDHLDELKARNLL